MAKKSVRILFKAKSNGETWFYTKNATRNYDSKQDGGEYHDRSFHKAVGYAEVKEYGHIQTGSVRTIADLFTNVYENTLFFHFFEERLSKQDLEELEEAKKEIEAREGRE